MIQKQFIVWVGEEMRSESVHKYGPKNRVNSDHSLNFTPVFIIKPSSHFTNSPPTV